jgi:hypothetical protein
VSRIAARSKREDEGDAGGEAGGAETHSPYAAPRGVLGPLNRPTFRAIVAPLAETSHHEQAALDKGAATAAPAAAAPRGYSATTPSTATTSVPLLHSEPKARARMSASLLVPGQLNCVRSRDTRSTCTTPPAPTPGSRFAAMVRACMGSAPRVSVLVVSDYGGRQSEDWDYLRATLAGLRAQSCDEPFEVLLVDSAPAEEPMPPDVAQILPGLGVLRGAGESSCGLLNRAVETAAGEIVALLDGDCAPVPGWLAAGLAALGSDPNAVAVSGRTVYPDRGFSYRVLGALSRSFLDPGGPGPTRFISNNNAIVRRRALLAHPLGPPPRALAARLQTEAIRLDGGTLRFEPRMQVTHRFDGWAMERRLRRNVGYRAVRVRQLDPRVPHAWMTRLGVLSVPLIVSARILDSFRDCLRVGRQYGVRWFEMPLAFAAAIAVHLLEIGGMRAAMSDAHRPARRS